MCCLLEELSKYKQIRKCNVASFEKEKNQLRKCDVASCKKMQLRKCNFGSCIFSHSPLHLFWCRCIFVCIFLFFFVKKIQKLIKVAKKMQRRKCNVASCKKMQRRKCNVGSCIFFAFSVPDELFMYRIFVSLHPFAFHYTPPPNPSSRPCPSPQLHLTLSAFHACSLLFTPLSPSTLSSEQEWRCWVEAEMNM